MERVHERAPEVLAAFLAAGNDGEVANALATLVDVPPEMAADMVRHLQFRELTQAAPLIPQGPGDSRASTSHRGT